MQDVSGQNFDREGYRRNVGMVILNDRGEVLIANRIGFRDRWQFPQGGVHPNEPILTSVFRELHEEVGLSKQHVQYVASTTRWMRYRIPPEVNVSKLGIGQTQRWFLLRFIGRDCNIKLNNQGVDSEFNRYQWVNYWEPIQRIVRFKRHVYQNMLEQLHPDAMSLVQGL